MKKNAILSKLLFISIIFIIASCTSTLVISSWSSSNPPAGAMKKVLIVGVISNRETKDQIEQAMSNALNSDGVNASTSMAIFGPNGFKGLQESDELIYSTQTRSYDPNNARDLATSFAKSIMAELRAKRIVQ